MAGKASDQHESSWFFSPPPQRIHQDLALQYVLNPPASCEVLLLPLLPLGSHYPREARTPLNNVQEIILIPAYHAPQLPTYWVHTTPHYCCTELQHDVSGWAPTMASLPSLGFSQQAHSVSGPLQFFSLFWLLFPSPCREYQNASGPSILLSLRILLFFDSLIILLFSNDLPHLFYCLSSRQTVTSKWTRFCLAQSISKCLSSKEQMFLNVYFISKS